MTTASDTALARGSDILVALALLTRLPGLANTDRTRGARAAWAYPVAGACVAAIAWAAGAFALWMGLAPPFAAGLALLAAVMVTGALHEDGLADVADGFWGGWDTARRLEIMKDSRIGSYGVIALGLSLILRWAALTMLLDAGGALWAFVAAGAASRAGMASVMGALPHAREGGLSHATGRPEAGTIWLGVLVAAGIGLVAVGFGIFAVALAVAVVCAAAALVARSKIGGQTGDVLGAAQQLAEIAALMVLASA
ncbi:adenosylcobinamide-GDP ribazoletransferase [Anianabacter salinae]|uniref:adenosylcobinamide-GDP ribazoletransferase n=1 Tax=Anianabacter salinae TaxID=2851023 RepID=UPI00225E1947|nr:adenosylcobinamide-GDP ribazoletransferase [Anianabacter salinae]MBV0911606.1 adenosylcobinamide-GDP ribazoletransferase [Anianabacter salinae]